MGTLSLLARRHLSWPPCPLSMSSILYPGGSQQVSTSDRLRQDAFLQGEAFCISRIWELAVMEKNTSRSNMCLLKCHLLVHECIGNMITTTPSTIQSRIPINFWKEELFCYFCLLKLILLSSISSEKHKTPHMIPFVYFLLLFWSKKSRGQEAARCVSPSSP